MSTSGERKLLVHFWKRELCCGCVYACMCVQGMRAHAHVWGRSLVTVGCRKEADVSIDPTFNVSVVFGKRDEPLLVACARQLIEHIRLCPIRSGGYECGCLPILARMVMEQCVTRLDVAMFNAILRESANEMPTDPVSDPIVDPKVLPILAGDLSFGYGAQLKILFCSNPKIKLKNHGMRLVKMTS